MELIEQFGEMWARSPDNIERVPGSGEGGQGVYVLYEGSIPVYIGKGNIRQRLRAADRSKRRGNAWNYFGWYVIKDKTLIHDVEVLLLRMLPPYLRRLTRQRGQFTGARHAPNASTNIPTPQIDMGKLMRSSK